jgi:hypothetical protein
MLHNHQYEYVLYTKKILIMLNKKKRKKIINKKQIKTFLKFSLQFKNWEKRKRNIISSFYISQKKNFLNVTLF